MMEHPVHLHGIGLLFIYGKFVDQAQDFGHIFFSGGTDFNTHNCYK